MNKILIIAPSLNIKSGVTNHIITYYRKIKKSFDIDFLIFDNKDKTLNEELINNGSYIHVINKFSFSEIKNFIKSKAKEYDIIHCHTFNYGFIPLFYAKKYKIPNRIIHVHSVKYSDNLIKNLINKILLKLCIRKSNYYFCCSDIAGKKAFNNRNYTVINNCIDIDKFIFNNKDRNIMRKKLNVNENETLFGMVGRLTASKNPLFALEVFSKLKQTEKYKNSKFVFIGSGDLKEKIINKGKDLKLNDYIMIIENVPDVYNYYKAMDCFIFPSLHEGLGMVLIEAQASGLKCFCNINLPKEVFISKLIYGIELTKSPDEWSRIISQKDIGRLNVENKIIENGFSVDTESKKLTIIYKSMLKGEN